MKLYISNTTRQNHLFQVRWRGDHSGRVFSRIIPSGNQIELTDRDVGADAKQKWEDVQAHLDRVGARDAAELHRNQIEDYRGISYRYEDAVTSDEIQMGHEMVLDNAARTSAEEAVKAAQGFDLALNGEGTRRARVTGVEVIEDQDPRRGPTEDEVKFSVSVDPTVNAKSGKLKRRGK